ncbi:MAG: sigma-70 family RNA polymerase sigma factor [Thermoleophilia bacterium]|nr:sigma-70 family RNA polymerase sigma factor [Thermoleophilia bacterium]
MEPACLGTSTGSASTTVDTAADARRRLCLGAMAGAPGLLRYAARFAPTLQDAEDAYQRGMEVALSKGPIGDQQEFINWLHVVIRNEATTLARMRTRELPAGDGVVVDTIDAIGNDPREPAAVAEWRERYRTLQDALTSLNEAERICLLLRTAGVSRAEIGTMTGFTDRKVERSIVRGRARLNEWHLTLASGERCTTVRSALERIADRDGDGRDRRQVSRHVRHCGHCRATLRSRRQTNAGLLPLIPVAIIATTTVGAVVPDPSLGITLAERGTARMAVGIGQAWQGLMDLPTLMTARVGAGAIAITVVGVAGVPLMARTVADGQRTTTPLVAVMTTTTASVGATPPAAALAEQRRLQDQIARDHERRVARQRAAREAADTRRRRAAAANAAATGGSRGSSPSLTMATPAATPETQPQLEFGP